MNRIRRRTAGGAVAASGAAADSSAAKPGDLALGDRMVAQGLITPAQLADALALHGSTGKPLAAALVELGALDERRMTLALADDLDFPLLNLASEPPDAAAARCLPEALCRSLGVVPVRATSDSVLVAVPDPSDPFVVGELLRAVAPLELELGVAPASEIRRATDRAYESLAGLSSFIEAFEATEATRRADLTAHVVSDDAPVVQVLNRIVTEGVRARASDVHIEPQNGRVRIRFRIDGALHDVLGLPESMGPAVTSRLKVMANMNIVERRRAQDGQVVMEVDGRYVDIRIATAPTIWGEKAVLRLLDRTRTLHRVDELGMPVAVHAQFSRLVRAPVGMVVCAGPTGSGKTTTLYATLTEINQPDRNVTTVEDPVEYVFSSINQIQINEQTGMTFAGGLRAILRQDPDVILVGEIRDAETARIAVEAALTGHLVLSSVHATDACSALQRLVDMGIEPFLIASTVSGIVSQRLVRRICDRCRAPYTPTAEELAFYEHAGGRVMTAELPGDGGSAPRFTRGHGCDYCARTGYRERTGVFELLRVSDEIKKLLVAGASLEDLRAASSLEGMQSLLDGGIQLVDDGTTTIGEIMRSIYVL